MGHLVAGTLTRKLHAEVSSRTGEVETTVMRSTTIPRARNRARRASDSPTAHALARAGLTARGIIYILIGSVAVLGALGHGAREAAYGVAGGGTRAGPRMKSLARAVVYAGLAYLTFEVISGTQGSQSRRQQDITAKAMQHPGGRWLVGIAGLIVVIIGLVLVNEGIRRRFMKYLRTSQMSPRTRRIVRLLAVIGTVARGLAIALVGILVIDANPATSGGVDKALLTLRNQAFGPVLLMLVALGLVIFGLYGLCEARWRKV